MTLKLDFDFIFDGAPPKEFVQAVKLVSSGKFKPDFNFRRDALDLGILSDFFAGQGNVPGGLGLEGFLGFLGEPDEGLAASRGYRNPKSAPDAEFTYETAISVFGEEIAKQLEAGVQVWKKTEQSANIVTDWMKYCLDPRIIKDDPSTLGEEMSSFNAHRNDQSILTNIAIREGLSVSNQ